MSGPEGAENCFKRVLDAYEKLEADLKENVYSLFLKEGYIYHTCGDVACEPEKIDWVVGDSAIRTSKARGVSYMNYKLFENWQQNPNRGSAITMVCCAGKELSSILDVLARVPAMNNLLVVWQGNEYEKSYKQMQF